MKEAVSALIALKMPRNSELSDFQKGEIVGYQRNGRSLKDISKELNIPKSTVAFVIKKWKMIGDCRNVLRSGRPKKLTDKDRRVLTKEIRKKPHQTNGTHTPRVPKSNYDCCFD